MAYDRVKQKQKWRQDNPTKDLLIRTRARAKKKGWEFDLVVGDIIIPNYCPVLGIALQFNTGKGKASDNSPSIDRIDSSRGYTKDNIVVVSWRANSIKKDSTVKELQLLAAYYSTLF